MFKQLNEIIAENVQSGLRANQSWEVSDGLRLSVDFVLEAVLILLDLTDIFDTIHGTLINCLKLWVVSSMVLN